MWFYSFYISVYSLGLYTFSLTGVPCNTCTDGHIREPFMGDAHALRPNCSFYMCLAKWHDHIISCSAWPWQCLSKVFEL